MCCVHNVRTCIPFSFISASLKLYYIFIVVNFLSSFFLYMSQWESGSDPIIGAALHSSLYGVYMISFITGKG